MSSAMVNSALGAAAMNKPTPPSTVSVVSPGRAHFVSGAGACFGVAKRARYAGVEEKMFRGGWNIRREAVKR